MVAAQVAGVATSGRFVSAYLPTEWMRTQNTYFPAVIAVAVLGLVTFHLFNTQQVIERTILQAGL
jgi:hypothetical protein